MHLSVEVLSTTAEADCTTRKRVVLTFDTPSKQSFEIALWEPANTDQIVRPLVLTQPRDYQLPWAEEPAKRGYMVCLYPGLDAHHSEDDNPVYIYLNASL